MIEVGRIITFQDNLMYHLPVSLYVMLNLLKIFKPLFERNSDGMRYFLFVATFWLSAPPEVLLPPVFA